MRNAGQDESQAGLDSPEMYIQPQKADFTTLMADSKGTKEPLDEGGRGEVKKLA